VETAEAVCPPPPPAPALRQNMWVNFDPLGFSHIEKTDAAAIFVA
jgi:hypothetical protein